MKLTNAQDELLLNLENGWEVTFKDGYYTQIKGDEVQKLWPSTFYGLYDLRLVVKTESGTYTISQDGRKQLTEKS